MDVAADRQLCNVIPSKKGARVGMLTADRAAICMDEMNTLFALPHRPTSTENHDEKDDGW